MKNVGIIGTLGVTVLVLASFLYKECHLTIPQKFPIIENQEKLKPEVELYLNVFFSKNNCRDCLEIIEVLNALPAQFSVQGIVPPDELDDEKELRKMTGATFPLVAQTNMYRNVIPIYYPATVGVGPNGDVFFVLPGVPGQKEYLAKFLCSFYKKVFPIFLERKLKLK